MKYKTFCCKFIYITIILLFLGIAFMPRNTLNILNSFCPSTYGTNDTESIEVTFQELHNNPNSYNNKKITVTGVMGVSNFAGHNGLITHIGVYASYREWLQGMDKVDTFVEIFKPRIIFDTKKIDANIYRRLYLYDGFIVEIEGIFSNKGTLNRGGTMISGMSKYKFDTYFKEITFFSIQKMAKEADIYE